MPSRAPAIPLGFGAVTTDHVLLFHSATSVPEPTAKQLVPVAHDTFSSSFMLAGLGAIDHVVPFQLSTNAWDALSPTAMQVDAPAHERPLRVACAPPAGGGLGATVQLVPLHRSITGKFPNGPTR